MRRHIQFLLIHRILSGLLLVIISGIMASCNVSDVKEAIDAGEDLAQGVDRQPIDRRIIGVNAFVNDSRFGSINAQFREIKSALGISYVRVLFNWDDLVQPSPNAPINFSFYDDIIDGLPSGVDALVVLTGIPSWMSNQNNWSNGNPRLTFVEKFVRRALARYGGRGRIIGWQIWNEPNMASNPDNQIMDLAENPENYVEVLAAAHAIVKDASSNQLVLNAATTAINQNFPNSLDYNQRMVDAGVNSFVDRYAIHYYGRQFENLVRPDGVADFLNSRVGAVWVTESGAQGVDKQLAYGEQVWPYLQKKLARLERIYIYQFAEATSADTTYGLKNLTPGSSVSDLYLSFR